MNVSYQPIAVNSPMSGGDALNTIKDNFFNLYFNNQAEQSKEEGITACYERLSNDDMNDGESNSIANQKRILERHCKECGYTSIQHYEDDGFTGTNFERLGFQKMLADIKAGKVSRVVVKDMSRFGRDYLQVGMYTDMVFPEFGVHFLAVSDGVDSKRGDNEFTAIRNIFNEMHARDTSKKVCDIMKSKGMSGERLTTSPPYGYKTDPNDRKKWLVDEEAAAVIQTIFSLCMSGMGPGQIRKYLMNNQVLTPSAYWASKGVKHSAKPTANPYGWVTHTISDILERIEYLGHTVNFRTYKKSYKDKKVLLNSPDKWVIFQNTHEPIIEESVFLIVQNLRKTRKRPTKMGDMGLFSGILYCVDCGAKMYLCRAKSLKLERHYYICSNYRKDRNLCTTHTIRNVILEEIVTNNLREAISYVTNYEDDFVREAADIAFKEQNKELAANRKALADSEKRIAELDVIIKRLYEDNISGKLTDERFLKLSCDYEIEQKSLATSIETLRCEMKRQEQKKSDVKKFIAITKKYTELKVLDPTILREFVDRIEIYAHVKKGKERKIHIIYNFIGAFDFEAAMEQVQTI